MNVVFLIRPSRASGDVLLLAGIAIIVVVIVHIVVHDIVANFVVIVF